MCVYFCVSKINMHPSKIMSDPTAPYEQFTGRKLNAKTDLRINFDDYAQATEASTDNTMTTRIRWCIAGFPTGSTTGSVKMLCLSTNKIVTRDQFRISPTPSLVCDHITAMAKSEGYIRGADPTIGQNDNFKGTDYELVPLPDMLKIYDSPLIRTEPCLDEAGYPDEQGEANLYDPTTNVEEAQIPVPEVEQVHSEQRPEEHDSEPTAYIDVSISNEVTPVRRCMRERKMPSHLDNYAFKISVRSALKSRRDEADTVVAAELQQLLDKKVWQGVHASDLTQHERSHVIRSSMFLKDKHHPSGDFNKFKARLVAGGDGLDKSLYECLSSPTVATSSVMILAAIAAREGRRVKTMDIRELF
jgi:hypothetical protein